MSVRLQFDIPDDMWEEAARYIPSEKARHVFGRIAFEEWLNRRKGRDKKLQAELFAADKKRQQKVFDEMHKGAHG